MESKGDMVPVAHVYQLLLEQVRANNTALLDVQRSNTDVQAALAVARSQLEADTRSFDTLRQTQGSFDERLRKVEQGKVETSACDGKHGRGGDFVFKLVMALLGIGSLVVAVILASTRNANAQEVLMEPAVNPSWLANLSVWTNVLTAIVFAAYAAAHTSVEAAKVASPWLATATGPWPAWVKRGIALVVGMLSGLCGAASSPEVPWFLCIAAGGLGGACPAFVRGITLAKRATSTGPGDSGTITGMLAIFVLCGGMAAGSLGCSAAQVQAWKDSGKTLAQCYADCGLDKAGGYIQDWKRGVSISGEDVGWDAFECALPCVMQAGAVLVPGLMLASTEDSAPASVSSSLVADPDGKLVSKAVEPPGFCKVKPELLDNSKRALREACGCGAVPRCSVVVRNE